MFNYNKQRFLIVSMISMVILFTSTIANAAYNSNYNSKYQTNVYSNSFMLINLDKTPDQIARSSEADVIKSLEQSNISKK